MWKLVLAVVALGFTIAPASAKNRVNKVKPPVFQETKTAELNELSDEYLECSAYFLVTAYCIGGYPAPAVPKIIRDYQQAAKKALGLAASTGRVTEALVEARSKSVAAAQMQSINSNCMNIRDLSERYDAFCKQLTEAPDTRIKELISGRMCTGLYKCSLSSKSGTTAPTDD
jgi:hypothetical protein